MSKSLTTLTTTDLADAVTVEESQAKSTWKDYLTISKSGIVFSNLITTFTGLWLALQLTGQSLLSSLWNVVFVLIGSALVIAGGCALNNYIDRDIDQLMERTQDRPSATGKLTGKQVLWAGIIMSVLGMLALLQTTYMAALCGLIGLFVYVVIYTMWLKRTHSINTIVGGISGAVPPLIGWAAIDPTLSTNVPWILFLFMFIWQPPHFLALAMKRVEEYRRAGIPMLPVVAGFEMTKRQMIVYVAFVFPVSLFLYSLGPVYLVPAVLLGLGWVALSVTGFFTKDIIKWARLMFVYSINYMTLLFIFMIIATFFL